MSDRQKNLRNIINFEYPWSSDDEDARQFIQPTSNNVEVPTTTSQPGPSPNNRRRLRFVQAHRLPTVNDPVRLSVRSRFVPGNQQIRIHDVHHRLNTGTTTGNINTYSCSTGALTNAMRRVMCSNINRRSLVPPRRDPLPPPPAQRAEPMNFARYDNPQPSSSVLPPMASSLPDPIEVDSPRNVSLEEIVELDMECDPPLPPLPAGDPPPPVALPSPAEPAEPGTAPVPAAEPEPTTSNKAAEVILQPHGVKRKRESSVEASETEPITFKELNQNLLRLLECPVCLDWMEPPMAQCRRGHMLCGRCRARLASCPVCRTSFSSMRNRAMEGVAEMLRYPCRHGCGREVRLRRRSPHEASCPARRYRCPAPACEHAPLALPDLPEHLRTKHSSILKMGGKHKFSLKMNTEQRQIWVVAALHELFALRVAMDASTWGATAYVAYIGPKCNAKNYIYEVTVTGMQNFRKIVYSRTTHSDLESSSLNMSRQDCFYMPVDQAINFLRAKNRAFEAENVLTITIEITKCEQDGVREDTDS